MKRGEMLTYTWILLPPGAEFRLEQHIRVRPL